MLPLLPQGKRLPIEGASDPGILNKYWAEWAPDQVQQQESQASTYNGLAKASIPLNKCSLCGIFLFMCPQITGNTLRRKTVILPAHHSQFLVLTHLAF